ncbi:hypothetical protein OROMI_012007 [Orobanche minor]
MSKYLFLCLILSFLLKNADSLKCEFFTRKTVHVFNDLPNETLFVHCKSEDNKDLGVHYVKAKQDYNFEFCSMTYITLYTCHVQWGKNKLSFEAYNGNWVFDNPCAWQECRWAAKPDGLYLQGLKKFDWKQ